MKLRIARKVIRLCYQNRHRKHTVARAWLRVDDDERTRYVVAEIQRDLGLLGARKRPGTVVALARGLANAMRVVCQEPRDPTTVRFHVTELARDSMKVRATVALPK